MKRHFVLHLHSHLTEITEDATDWSYIPFTADVQSPRIHVWARTPMDAISKIEDKLGRLVGDEEPHA